MLLTEKQTEQYIERFKKNYSQYCPIEKDGRLGIATIYCENPEEEEEKHKQKWLEEIKKLMWKNANKTYVHRGGRKESYAEAQLAALRLYHWPTFRHISEKKD